MHVTLECGCNVNDAVMDTQHSIDDRSSGDVQRARYHYPIGSGGPKSFCMTCDLYRPCMCDKKVTTVAADEREAKKLAHDQGTCGGECQHCKLKKLEEYFQIASQVYPNTPAHLLVFRVPEGTHPQLVESFRRMARSNLQCKIMVVAGEMPIKDWPRDKFFQFIEAEFPGTKILTHEQTHLIKNSLTIALLSPGIDNVTREAFKKVADLFKPE